MFVAYGDRGHLALIRTELSRPGPQCMHVVPDHSEDRRTNRFVLLDEDGSFFPSCRSNRKVVIEIRMMSGRRPTARSALIGAPFQNDADALSIPPVSVEITITG